MWKLIVFGTDSTIEVMRKGVVPLVMEYKAFHSAAVADFSWVPRMQQLHSFADRNCKIGDLTTEFCLGVRHLPHPTWKQYLQHDFQLHLHHMVAFEAKLVSTWGMGQLSHS